LETSLIDQGIELMLVGMTMMSTIALKFTANTALVTNPDGANEEEIAAITAAIAQHRKTQSK